MKINLSQKLAQYTLETGTYSFGIFDEWKIDSLSIFVDDVKQKFGVFDKEISEFVELLKRLNIIDKVGYIKASTINPELTGFAYECEVSIPRLKNFIENGDNKTHAQLPIPLIKIKNAEVDKTNYILEINNGQITISFKSRKKKQGLEKETRIFKLLCVLWDKDFRWEIKNDKVAKKGEYHTLENLKRISGSATTGATQKSLIRLNSAFKEKGLPIVIEGKNEKYRLILYLS